MQPLPWCCTCRIDGDALSLMRLYNTHMHHTKLLLRVVNEMQMLSMMARKFPDFDVAGKRMFLDKVGVVFWLGM